MPDEWVLIKGKWHPKSHLGDPLVDTKAIEDRAIAKVFDALKGANADGRRGPQGTTGRQCFATHGTRSGWLRWLSRLRQVGDRETAADSTPR